MVLPIRNWHKNYAIFDFILKFNKVSYSFIRLKFRCKNFTNFSLYELLFLIQLDFPGMVISKLPVNNYLKLSQLKGRTFIHPHNNIYPANIDSRRNTDYLEK